jgi:methylenetetrahydrofolate reductase (NADPH)
VEARYEILPFERGYEEASRLPEPRRLTVTTSPKHGVDHSLAFGERVRGLGHGVTLHLAVRMVRSAAHLDEVVERAHAAGIDDLFVIGGDAPEPLGPYAGAAGALEWIAGHPRRPRALGIAGYPEGHPLIAQDVLAEALDRKVPLADYLVSQLCFDAAQLLTWLHGLRARGIELPLYVGAAGPVDRRRLLDVSLKIGVGPSLRYLRKQGVGRVLRTSADAATRFHDGLAPVIAGRADMPGFHFFTFNELTKTVNWHEGRAAARQPLRYAST